jgi:hypothetical protein
VKFLVIVTSVLVSDNELADLLDGKVMRLAPVVQQLSSTNVEKRFERFRGVVQPCVCTVRTDGRSVPRVMRNPTCMDHPRFT